MHTHKGLAPVVLVIILALILGGGYAAYRSYQQPTTNNRQQEKQANTDTKDLSRGEVVRDWKTYRNEKYGFEFRYPAAWNIRTSRSLPAYEGTDFLKDGVLVMTIHNPIPEIGYEAWRESKEEVIPITGSTKVFHKFFFTPLYPDFGSFLLVNWDIEDWQHSGRLVIPNMQPDDARLKMLDMILSTFRFTK